MKKKSIRESMTAVILFSVLSIMTYLGIQDTSESSKKEQIIFLKKAVTSAIVECYAIEGMYPPNIAYVEDNYGVIINHECYIVHYEAFAANIMPDISVIEKARGE